MEGEYLKWLIESIDPDHAVGDYYQPVYNELYLLDFRWTKRFPDDESRAADGIWLRRIFAEENGLEASDIGIDWKPCSCLEMLVAIARRIEYEILAWPGEENVPKWFWMFMENLDIDPGQRRIVDLNYVDIQIDNWLDRHINRDGAGGIFVIHNTRFLDMRKLSIWNQMNAVLNETADF